MISWLIAAILLSSSFLPINDAFSLDYQPSKQGNNLLLANHYLSAQQTSIVSADFGSQFQLKFSEVASINSGEVKLKFLNVTEDSRCPANTNCFWSGQIQVSLEVEVNSRNLENLNLISNMSRQDLDTVRFCDYVVKLVKVDPYPQDNQAIEITDYTLTLLVTLTKND